MDPVAIILERGDQQQRDALERFAKELLDSDAAIASPAEHLSGLGTRPSRRALVQALRRNAQRLWDFRTRLYATGLTYAEAARRLGVSSNQITNLVRAGDLYALDGPEGLKLPAWQFHPEAPRGRLPGIARVAAVFPGRILGLSAWMVSSNPLLHGRTPADALADGEVELVCEAAAAQQ